MGATVILSSVIKTVAATAAAGLAAWGLHGWTRGLDLAHLGHTIAAAIHVLGPLAAAVASFLLVAVVLRMKEPGWLLTRRQPAS